MPNTRTDCSLFALASIGARESCNSASKAKMHNAYNTLTVVLVTNLLAVSARLFPSATRSPNLDQLNFFSSSSTERMLCESRSGEPDKEVDVVERCFRRFWGRTGRPCATLREMSSRATSASVGTPSSGGGRLRETLADIQEATTRHSPTSALRTKGYENRNDMPERKAGST